MHMYHFFTISYYKQRVIIIGLIAFQCFYLTAQNNDILSDIMNGQFNDYEIVNQSGINTSALEFSPSIYLDSLVYVANGRTEGRKSKSQAASYFNLYKTFIDQENHLVGETPLSGVLNSTFHEGPLTFNKEGTEVFFTRNNQVEGARNQKKMNLSIFTSTKVNGIWSKPIELFASNNEFSFCHPSLNSAGDRLYFSSNMPGGYGNYDLYFIEKVTGIWSSPINVGSVVNTGDNELFPNLLSDETLSFSSNRPNGLGGLDIYVAELKDGKAYSTELLPEPLNSGSDDISLVISPDPSVAFFTSSRPGGAGQDDIYAILPKKQKPTTPVDQSFVVMDSIKLKRLANVTITISTDDGNPVYSGLTDRNGSLKAKLQEGKSYKYETTISGYKKVQNNFIPGQEMTLRLLSDACISLKGVAMDKEKNKPLTNIEVNLVLDCEDEVMTRITDGSGAFEFCVPQDCRSFISSRAKDYYDLKLNLATMTEEKQITLEFIKEQVSILKDPIKVGGTIILENIYYDFNKSTIRPGTERELNELATLLEQNPNMEIKLVAHTDSRGDAKENVTLSLSRAQEAKNYLISKGVGGDKISIEGRGETQPRNRCKDGVNCTEEEHQYNRRMEVIIKKK